jgi:hypothetical protein
MTSPHPHLFLSYARKDNISGRITAFHERLRADYLAATGQELRAFFDIHDIHGMDDWRHNILSHLRHCHILLACLSPAYLDSDPCRWEFEEYLKGEVSHGVSGSGIAPVYIAEIPGWKSREYESHAPDWVRRLRRRQVFDLPESGACEALIARLAERIRRAQQSASSPGVDPHNEFFRGRNGAPAGAADFARGSIRFRGLRHSSRAGRHGQDIAGGGVRAQLCA